MIIPCYDDGRLLPEAIASVREPEPVEIVVVDDASTDPETRAILDRLRPEDARVLRLPENGGVGNARMEGMRASRSRFVFPLDSDDLAEPGALAGMADRLDADPGAVACVGEVAEFGSHELVRAVPLWLDPYRLAYTNEYPVSSLFRREALEAVGGWHQPPGEGRGYEDWNLWLHFAERGEHIVHLGRGRVGYRRRLHGPRLNDLDKSRHAAIYQALRDGHPELFARLREHRRRSDLPPLRKLLYPIVYGGRARIPLEPQLKRLADRLGLWTNVHR